MADRWHLILSFLLLLALSACTARRAPTAALTATAQPALGATATPLPKATPTLPPDCGSAARIAADRRNDTYRPRPEFIEVNASSVKEVFDTAEDEDWFALAGAVAGVTYTIQTRDLAPGVDTMLTILDANGQPVASDDNSGGGKAPRLEWQPPSDGRYDVLVTRAPGSAYGCEAEYSLEVTAPPATLTLHNGGQIQYIGDNVGENGIWATYTRPSTVLAPGWRCFRFNGHEMELRIRSGVIEETVAVVLCPEPYDADAWLIDPDKVEYLDNGWQPAYYSGYEGYVDGWVCAVPGRRQELTVRVTYEGAIVEKTQDIIADPIIIFHAGKVHSSSGSCTHYYAGGEWRPFRNDMLLLPLTYAFRFNDGTPDTEYAVVAGAQTDVH